MERYDIAIIGTGPAGLEAAITAKIRNKNILLIGSKESSVKVSKAHTIKNYLGIKDVAGSELAARFLEHLKDMDVEIVEDKISAVYAMGEYFSLQGAEVIYEAKSVILATGVVLGKPVKGEMEYLGKGVSYCATCDAMLYRGKTVAVVGYSSKEEKEAAFLAEGCEKVYYYPQYKEEVGLKKDNIVITAGKPKEIAGDDVVRTFITDQNETDVSGVFILRESVSPGQLVPGIETDGGHVKVNRALETNIKGCFAAGDITGAPYQYIKAAGEGNVAALSATAYLDA